MRREEELSEKIADALKKAGFTFHQEVPVGGVRPDFIVESPDGRLIIVETKAWKPQPGFVARAAEQAEHYQKATGAKKTFVVLDQIKRNYERKGVVSPDGLVQSLEKFVGSKAAQAKQRGVKSFKKGRRTIFAAMPFDREYDDVFFVAMRYAAKAIGAVCERVDRWEFTGDIVAEIKHLIEESSAVIVDLSESKPNVLYEAGYAHALGKKCIHITSTPLTMLPFDIRNWNTLEYKKGQTTTFRNQLAKRLKAVLRY